MRSIHLIKKPEIFFVIVCALFGAFISIFNPYDAGFDEYTHTVRIWEISKFDLIPNNGKDPNELPIAFYQMAYFNSRVFLDTLTKNDIQRITHTTINPEQTIRHFTHSVYFPLLYFPDAFIMGILLRILNNIPVIIPLTLIKLVNLAFYILLTWMAIKKIPFGKWVLTTIALAPIVVFESAIVSIDYLNFGGAFLFISWTLYIVYKEKPINRNEFIVLLLLIAVLTMLKPNTFILLLLLFLIPKSQLPQRRWRAILILSTFLSFLVFFVFWNILAYSNFYMNSENVSALGGLKYILSHPLNYLRTLFQEISSRWLWYIKGSIGLYGSGGGVVPPIVYWLFIPVLFTVSLFDNHSLRIKMHQRIFLIGLSILGILFTFTIVYLTINTIGREASIYGVQGRHLVVFIVLLFLGLAGSVNLKKPILSEVASLFNIAVLGFYCFGLFASYYIQCGSNLYSKGYCYLPKYKNWDPITYTTGPIHGQFLIEQSFVSKCNNLTEVRIMLGKDSSIDQGLMFALYGEDDQKLIYSNVIQPTASNLGTWISLKLDDPVLSLEKSFLMTIHPSNDVGSDYIFSTSERDEYLDGTLWINGITQDVDLLFQYGCDVARSQ